MNPMQLMQMVGQMQSGKVNPMQMLMQMSGTSPQMAQVMQLVQGKSPAQMQTIAQNMAKERGIDINVLANQMGLRI